MACHYQLIYYHLKNKEVLIHCTDRRRLQRDVHAHSGRKLEDGNEKAHQVGAKRPRPTPLGDQPGKFSNQAGIRETGASRQRYWDSQDSSPRRHRGELADIRRVYQFPNGQLNSATGMAIEPPLSDSTNGAAEPHSDIVADRDSATLRQLTKRGGRRVDRVTYLQLGGDGTERRCLGMFPSRSGSPSARVNALVVLVDPRPVHCRCAGLSTASCLPYSAFAMPSSAGGAPPTPSKCRSRRPCRDDGVASAAQCGTVSQPSC